MPHRHRTINEAASYVLTAALLHWEKLVPVICSHEDYAKAEGLFQAGMMQTFNAKRIARKFKLTGQSPELQRAA